MIITFQVDGEPQPKGSTKAFYVKSIGRAVVTEDNKKTRPWAALVRDAAAQVVADTLAFPRGVAVRLSIVFTMPRPVSLPKRVLAPKIGRAHV